MRSEYCSTPLNHTECSDIFKEVKKKNKQPNDTDAFFLNPHCYTWQLCEPLKHFLSWI